MSFFLVSRVPEAIFLLLAVVQGKRKGNTASHKGGKFPNLGTPGVLPKNHRPLVHHRPKKRPTETGTTRGGPHHAPRLRPDQCMLCRQVGHRASECPTKGTATSFSPGKRAFGTYALGFAAFDAMCHGATIKENEEDQDEKKSHEDRVWIHECSTSCGPIRGYHETEAASKKMDTARCFPARNFGERRVKRTSRPLFSSVWM